MMLKKIGLSLAIALSITAPAYALPGQNIETVVEWSENHPLLRKLIYCCTGGLLGTTKQYSSKFHFRQYSLYFTVWASGNKEDKGIVLIEEIRSSNREHIFF